MSHAVTRCTLILALAIVSSAISPLVARAAEYVVAIRGEITSVADDLNWFNDSIQVGMPLEGTYNFFDAGYERRIYSDPPSTLGYRFYVRSNNGGYPVLPANMHLAIGGHDYETDTTPSFFPYVIDVTNDSDGSQYPFVVGDGFRVVSPLPFPAHFTDWTGDPVNDPDGNFFPVLGMTFRLDDPTGTALSSPDLPLTAPDLAVFASAVGTLFIADGNGEPNFAVAEFRITSLQVVPEPSSLAICVAGLVFAGAIRSRKSSPCIALARGDRVRGKFSTQC